MKYKPEIGPYDEDFGWVPSPTFILRRAAILDLVKAWELGNVLEVGCGSGAISYELAIMGHKCTAVESSPAALKCANHFLAKIENAEVTDKVPLSQYYDYLVSFEVLEHIEDDAGALNSWIKNLKPGGLCLLSVPAHRNKWNITDVTAGHYRRYNRDDITHLANECGLQTINILTYGWPFSYIIEKLRTRSKERQYKKLDIDISQIELGSSIHTDKSGIDRNVELKAFPVYGSWLGRKLFVLANLIQRIFFRFDFGISFMLLAKKPE